MESVSTQESSVVSFRPVQPSFAPVPPPSLPPSGIEQIPPPSLPPSSRRWWILAGFLFLLFIGIAVWYGWSVR